MLVFLWFFVGGLCHFLLPAMFLRIMPPYVPQPELVIYLSGAFELLGALALWHASLRKWAGYGLMLLTICVTPANVYMWQHSYDFPGIPYWLLTLRLPIQALLLWVIWRATQPPQSSPKGSHAT